MPRKWWYIIGLFSMLIVVAVAVWLVTRHVDEFANAMGCTDTLTGKFDSPDKRNAALVFRRQCGATAPDSTQVSVQPVGTSLNTEKYKAVIVVDGAPALRISWDSPADLVVAGITSQHIYHQQSVAEGGINIRYEKFGGSK